MTAEKQTPLAGIEAKLVDATRNDALGWDAADVAGLGPECMIGFDRFDWQAYLPDEVRDLWIELPVAARLVAFLIARERSYFDDPPLS